MTKQEKIIVEYLSQNNINFESLVKVDKNKYEFMVPTDDIELRRHNYKKISFNGNIIRFGCATIKKFYCEFLKEKQIFNILYMQMVCKPNY